MIWLFLALFTLFLVGLHALVTLKECARLHGKSFFEALQKKTSLPYISNRKALYTVIEISENLARMTTIVCAALFLWLLPTNALVSLIVGIVLVLFFLFVSELTTRWIAEKNYALARHRAIAIFFIYLFLPLTFPLIAIKQAVSKPVEKLDNLDEMRDTLFDLIKASPNRDTFDAVDQKLMESVIQFKDLIVKEVMIPRIHLFSFSADTSIRLAAKLLVKEGYSRIPVYRETLDNIIGLLLYKDVLAIYLECEEGERDKQFLGKPIDTIMKGVFYTPETKKVSHLLQEFRSKQKHMAIVVNEYGGTEGVVTIEDILEEIVGEIADEYDVQDSALYIPDPKGQGWIVDARMNLKDAEDIFAILIPKEGDYDTLAGFIFHRQEMIPPRGTRIEETTFDLEILSASERSVEKVRLTPKTSSEAEQ